MRDIRALFTNRQPDDIQADMLDEITEAMIRCTIDVTEILPEGRFKSLALTKLEEASMWAKKAVLFPEGIPEL